MASLPGVSFSVAQALAGRRAFLRSGGVSMGGMALGLLEAQSSRGATLATPASPAGGGGAAAHSAGHNMGFQDSKRHWVRYP